MTEQEINEIDRKDELMREARFGRRASLSLFVFGILMMLALVWIGTYFIRSYILENKFENMDSVEQYTEEDSVDIVKVIYIVNDKEYELEQFLALKEIPTVIDTHIYYEDGTDSIKSSYVVYDDVGELVVEDGDYVKVILPNK